MKLAGLFVHCVVAVALGVVLARAATINVDVTNSGGNRLAVDGVGQSTQQVQVGDMANFQWGGGFHNVQLVAGRDLPASCGASVDADVDAVQAITRSQASTQVSSSTTYANGVQWTFNTPGRYEVRCAPHCNTMFMTFQVCQGDVCPECTPGVNCDAVTTTTSAPATTTSTTSAPATSGDARFTVQTAARRSRNRAPVRRATIACGGVSGRTNARGRATLKALPAGAHTCAIVASGHESGSVDIVVVAGARSSHVVQLVAKLGKITVHARNADGSAAYEVVRDARVACVPVAGPASEAKSDNKFSANFNDDGVSVTRRLVVGLYECTPSCRRARCAANDGEPIEVVIMPTNDGEVSFNFATSS